MKRFFNVKIILSIFIAFIFIQSMVFKFTGAPETVHIFSTIGNWAGLQWFTDYGAYGVGTVELIASILLFTRWHGIGAAVSFGVISGAIFFHLFTPLGIQMPEFNSHAEIVGNDGGTLFIMACLIWISSLVLMIRDMRSDDGVLKFIKEKSN